MKHIAFIIITIALSCVLTLPVLNDWETVTPDNGQRFRIWQSYINDGGGYRSTCLHVILCNTDTGDLDMLFEEIRAYHERMNGTPNRLTIHLYKSKIELMSNTKFATKEYEKGE